MDYDFACRLLNFKLLDWLTWRQQKIAQVVEVKLDHEALKFYSEVCHLADDVEHLNDGARSKTRILFITLDSECLARTGLTVSKDDHIVTINCALDQPLCVFKDILLGRFLIKYRVKVVILVAIVNVAYFDGHLVCLFVALYSFLRVCKLAL